MQATTAQQTQISEGKRRQAESEREKKAELFEVYTLAPVATG